MLEKSSASLDKSSALSWRMLSFSPRSASARLVSSATERESLALLVTPYCRFTVDTVRRAGFFALFDLGPRRSVRSLAELLSGVDLLASIGGAFADGVTEVPLPFMIGLDAKTPSSPC